MAKPDSSPHAVESKANVAGKTMPNSPSIDLDHTLPRMVVRKIVSSKFHYDEVMPGVVPLPFLYAGGDLGLGNDSDPWIEFRDSSGQKYVTDSVEWLLRNIDLFAPGRDQEQPLACAAHHYGLNTFALLGREHAESEGRTWAAQRAEQRGEA